VARCTRVGLAGCRFACAGAIVFDRFDRGYPQRMWIMELVWPITALYEVCVKGLGMRTRPPDPRGEGRPTLQPRAVRWTTSVFARFGSGGQRPTTATFSRHWLVCRPRGARRSCRRALPP
jgi:hypothetical protein